MAQLRQLRGVRRTRDMAAIWGFPGFAPVASRVASQKKASVNPALLLRKPGFIG